MISFNFHGDNFCHGNTANILLKLIRNITDYESWCSSVPEYAVTEISSKDIEQCKEHLFEYNNEESDKKDWPLIYLAKKGADISDHIGISKAILQCNKCKSKNPHNTECTWIMNYLHGWDKMRQFISIVLCEQCHHRVIISYDDIDIDPDYLITYNGSIGIDKNDVGFFILSKIVSAS